MYFSVVIVSKSNRSLEIFKNDLSEEQLMEKYVKPYEQGEYIMVNGRAIEPSDIEEISVYKSKQNSTDTIKRIKYEDRNSSVLVLGGSSYEFQAAMDGEEVSDEYIKGPAGFKRAEQIQVSDDVKFSGNEVFLVHGQDDALKTDCESFLLRLGLSPIVLHRENDEGLTVIEKFEKHSKVPFAVVLLSPDDVCITKEELKVKEEDRNYEFRARQNVIFELGYFMGKLGRSKVVCIYKKGVKIPSDLSGFIYKEIVDDIEQIGFSLIKELKNAGYKISI